MDSDLFKLLCGVVAFLFGTILKQHRDQLKDCRDAHSKCEERSAAQQEQIDALIEGDRDRARERRQTEPLRAPVPKAKRSAWFLPVLFLGLSGSLLVGGRCRDTAPEPFVEVPAARRAQALHERRIAAVEAAAAAEAKGDTLEARVQDAIAGKLAVLEGEQEHVAQAQRAELAEARAAEEARAEKRATEAQARRFGAYGIVAGIILSAVLIYFHAPLLVTIAVPVGVAGGTFFVASWWTSAAWIAPLIGYVIVALLVLGLAALVVVLVREVRMYADRAAPTGTADRALLDAESRARQWPPLRWILDHLFRHGVS